MTPERLAEIEARLTGPYYAAARSDVSALVDEVRRLQELLELERRIAADAAARALRSARALDCIRASGPAGALLVEAAKDAVAERCP